VTHAGDRAGPRVTVVIATYNWATVLPYSIGSVLDQTLRDFELFVIGDGCADESAEVVASFRDPRVQWVNLPQRTGHQAGPNNEGDRRARGDVIADLGHDDLWLPHHLELVVAAVEDGAPAAHSSTLLVHPASAPAVHPQPGWEYTPGAWIPPTSLAVSRQALRQVGGWRTPRETGRLDPEAELLARIRAALGPSIWVPRVTCVKLPAAERRNVYRTRPNAEQRHWLQLIRSAADPEEAVLATAPRSPAQQPPALATRAARRAVRALRQVLHLHGPTAETRVRRLRRFKGL